MRRDGGPLRGARPDRERFESFLRELCAAFVHATSETTGRLIELWLAKLAHFTDIDRISLWELDADGETVYRRHSHALPGYEYMTTALPTGKFGWMMDQNRQGRIVAWSRIPQDVPEEAAAEREHALQRGVKSLLSIPVMTSSILFVMAFVSVSGRRSWPPGLVQRLQLVAEILAGAVARQRIESSLQSSEARNRAMLKAMPDLMFVLSPEGVYLECHSRDHPELFVPPERFLGRPLEQVLPEDVARRFRNAFEHALHSNEMVEVGYSLRVQNELKEYEARMVRRDDGAVVSIVRNITERNRSARRLQESEERFRGAFEHSAIGMAIVSPDGRWLQTNRANCRMLGYPEAELLNMNFQKLTHPDDLPLNMQYLNRALAGEIDHYEFEKRYIHKDGREIPTLLSVSVVRDSQRRPLYFVSQLQDLSERRKAQFEIERLRLELGHFGRLAVSAQLTASLAHQLMQPISAIRSNAEACRRLVAGGEVGPAETLEILQDIVSGCARASDVINHVRSLLRKEPGPRLRVDVNQLVRDVVDVTSHYLSLHQVRLDLGLDGAAPLCIGNSIELRQVILNLLMNGAEAMSGIPAADRLLTITTHGSEDSIEITVRDCGEGLSPTVLQHIFEPFYTTKPEGLGMGLTICAEIVRSHGGQLWAENNPTGGMIFRCVLPVSRS